MVLTKGGVFNMSAKNGEFEVSVGAILIGKKEFKENRFKKREFSVGALEEQSGIFLVEANGQRYPLVYNPNQGYEANGYQIVDQIPASEVYRKMMVAAQEKRIG